MVYPAKLSQARVLDAALALVERDGRDALGMRAVADALGVRPASLYKHIGDLASLEALLADAAAAACAAALDTAFDAVPAAERGDPAAALRATAAAYVRFARERPALYALLLVPDPPDRPATPARKALWNRLLAAVGALTGDPDDTAGAVATWALLHGFIALERAGLYGASGPQDGLARGVDALARGLRPPARDAADWITPPAAARP